MTVARAGRASSCCGPASGIRRAVYALLVGLLLTTAGCAGAHVEVTARQSRYTISMSQLVRDHNGTLRDPRSLDRVGSFYADRTRLGFFYSLLTPLSTFDISEAVNEQVAAVGGEAVIGLTVSASDGCDVLNNFAILNILPIWPGCVPVTVTGDIVRRRSGAQP
jgi:hypothetical protein